MNFIDLFAGCGGLSLGLSMAGMKGVFAVEKDAMAFETFEANFLGQASPHEFSWPEWLEKKPWPIQSLIREHSNELIKLQGKIDVIAGGPPCQGFSFSGKRDEDDPRNKLFREYVRIVAMVKPKAVIVENVPGMAVTHNSSSKKSFFEKLKEALEDCGYVVDGVLVDPVKLGVPQKRTRLIVIGIRKDLAQAMPAEEGWYSAGVHRVFRSLVHDQRGLVDSLPFSLPVSTSDAISDLETRKGRGTQTCIDPRSPKGFKEVVYTGPETTYQKFMNAGHQGARLDSTRLTQHREHVELRFSQILAYCSKGTRMNEADRKHFGLNKHRVCTLDESQPSMTITTLPDDIIHYSEPRILSVRECARLQSFPDWFEFRGKFTTGGDRRTQECPRYTQVGNAVPPLLGRAVGLAVIEAVEFADSNLRSAKRFRAESRVDLPLAA